MQHYDINGMEVYTKFKKWDECIVPIPMTYYELCQKIMNSYRLEPDGYEILYEDDNLGQTLVDSDKAYENAICQRTGQGIYLIINEKSVSPSIPMGKGPKPQFTPINDRFIPLNVNTNLSPPFQQTANASNINLTTLPLNALHFQPMNNLDDSSRSMQVNNPNKPTQNPPPIVPMNQNSIPQFQSKNHPGVNAPPPIFQQMSPGFSATPMNSNISIPFNPSPNNPGANIPPPIFQQMSPGLPAKPMNSNMSIPFNPSPNNPRNSIGSPPIPPPQIQPLNNQKPMPANIANFQQTPPNYPPMNFPEGSPGLQFKGNINQGVSFPQNQSPGQTLNLPRNSLNQTILNSPLPPALNPFPPSIPILINPSHIPPNTPPSPGYFSPGNPMPNQVFSQYPPNLIKPPPQFPPQNFNYQQTIPIVREHDQNINQRMTQSLQINNSKCSCGAEKVIPNKQWRCDGCACLNSYAIKACPICELKRSDLDVKCPSCGKIYKI